MSAAATRPGAHRTAPGTIDSARDRRLRIAVLAHVRHPVRPPFAGGMEAHTWHLVRGLAERGHDVTLFASGDSDAGVPLFATVDAHYERDLPWHLHRGSEVLDTLQRVAFERAMRHLASDGFDVIHNNTLHPLPIRMAAEAGLAMLTSLHVPPFEVLHEAVRGTVSPGLHYTVTSRRQHAVWWGDTGTAASHVVHNGIDPREWPYREYGDGSAIWAGRIDPNKGTHLAAQAARLAGVPLTIVGPMEDRHYFDQHVAPLLDERVRHAGHLRGPELAERFGRASVLLFTPLWEEPFGLVAIEAMACGLPVAAIDNGAVREIVGDAGAYAGRDDAASLAGAMDRALRVPRTRARDRVERLFGRERMLDGYERLYPVCMAGAAGRLVPVPA